MLKRNLISFAIIVSGLFLANQAYGQSSINSSVNRGSQTQSIKSPRDVATGQLIDTSTGEIVWVRNGRRTSTSVESRGATSGNTLQISNRSGRSRGSSNLIDTSTGEIVWADEIRSTPRRRSAVDNEVAALVTW
ncbi:MAG: hypothetical protein JNL64_04945 [Blastocatellia bacterium]|nr:hypothetical protein [Blastocatellia bacterium]